MTADEKKCPKQIFLYLIFSRDLLFLEIGKKEWRKFIFTSRYVK